MSYIITRTNHIVSQVWEDNDANWEFFLAGMSRDVQWKNIGNREHPKKFKFWNEAKWYLDERNKRLPAALKKQEDKWEYHILQEVTK